ncbi:MAG: signal recognition particle-docking protein FtsY [Gammaproteobacteria bacterium]|nr:signal recognition particle-docking protein FtsY [Gammaproteobacteria bacterium]
MNDFLKKETKEDTQQIVDNSLDHSLDKVQQESSVVDSNIEHHNAENKSIENQEQQAVKSSGFLSGLKKGLKKTHEILNTDVTELVDLKEGLDKTREILNTDVTDLIKLKKEIDEEILEEIETHLLMADVGFESTQQIIDDLTQRMKRKELSDSDALFAALEVNMLDILSGIEQPLVIDKSKKPYVILMTGINGAGKTTTIGKLAKQYQNQGLSVMLAAGDTFRAAAVEQLQIWGDRNNIPVIAQHTGADSASVIYDAIEAGKARNIDVILADTAGRLHTQSNLMDELKKIKRVAAKVDETAPHEIMLVLDAGTGQNALSQAQHFAEAVDVSGITLTKLDGTAKGGIIFALAKKYNLPIRFIGIGEGIDDLRPFHAQNFVKALLARD